MAGDASSLINNVDVVGENSVTRILGDDTKGNDDKQSVSVSLGLEEVEIAGCGLLASLDSLLDLAVLELNGDIVRISTSMMLCEDLQSFVTPVLAHEPTGRFREPPDAANLDDGWHGLDEGD